MSEGSLTAMWRGAVAALLVGAVPAATAEPQSAVPQSQPKAEERPAPTVIRSGHELVVSCHELHDISCNIVAATVDAVKRELAAPGGKAVDTLVLEDTGGDADPIIDLGRLIHARHLTLKIDTICTFFCPALLTPATNHLIVPKDSFVAAFPILTFERQLMAGVEQQFAAKMGKEKADAEFQQALDRQNSYLRELNVDPDKAFGIGETALTIKAALAANGGTDQPFIVPDREFLQKCLGIKTVEMQNYTIADSVAIAHHGKAALAYLIDGKIYFDGKPIANYNPTCTAR